MKNIILTLGTIFLLTAYNISSAGKDITSFVQTGSVNSVRTLLATGNYDVNYVNEEGDTALMIAARRNDLEMMQVLFENNANPDVGAGRDYLLQLAANYNHQAMMDLINSMHTNQRMNTVDGRHDHMTNRLINFAN